MQQAAGAAQTKVGLTWSWPFSPRSVRLQKQRYVTQTPSAGCHGIPASRRMNTFDIADATTTRLAAFPINKYLLCINAILFCSATLVHVWALDRSSSCSTQTHLPWRQAQAAHGTLKCLQRILSSGMTTSTNASNRSIDESHGKTSHHIRGRALLDLCLQGSAS